MTKGKKIGLGVVIVLLLMQAKRIDKTVPNYSADHDLISATAAPSDIGDMLKNTCYDCHSYTTSYPWYTNVAPLSWLLGGHVKGGRMQVNFSEWDKLTQEKKKAKLLDCIEVLESNKMPMKSYTWMHSEAKLSDDDRLRLINWFTLLKQQ